jgi:hypothetical protein
MCRDLQSNANKHCSQILQETLLNSVSNDSLPFMVGQSHDSFTPLSVKDVMLFQHCQQAIQANNQKMLKYWIAGTLSNVDVSA